MDKDKRQGWLRELKIGDKVCIDCGAYGSQDYTFRIINKITPTGRMIINNTTYDHEGVEMGRSDRWYRRNRKVEYTDEIKNFIQRKNAFAKIRSIKWKDIPTDKILDILRILEGENDK